MPIKHKDLLGIKELEKDEIILILDTAESFIEVSERPIKKVPTLRGKTIINYFHEPSTRTRISFEIAAKRLSADAINFSQSGSSASKGETLLDTVRNLQAMRADILVMRHSVPGAAHFIASHLEASVINAGDGAHEHPTQALLDLLTIRQRVNQLEGLRVVIVGDIAYSRVARSNIFALKKMGADVTICGPTTLLPHKSESLDVRVSHNFDEVIPKADVLMMLRIQRERQAKMLLPSLREYSQLFCLTPKRLAKARENLLVMHPGPINRGVEIDPSVADGPFSIILNQVTNGVAVRMALLFLLAGRSGIEKNPIAA
ncbi:aspartate carbamoyltransferase catalytic subunit [bacterium]|nr:aspartate carbamoyltransferase catalytic subunit [candidate division CSSED10-310 bacterium]